MKRGNHSKSEHQPSLAIGLDVGGTKIAGGVVACNSGRVLTKRVAPTRPERGGKATLTAVFQTAEEMMAEAQALGGKVLGVGIGVAELVDLDGNVTSSYTIDWRGIPVQAHFSRLAPAVVDSDVRTAALAEAFYGAGRQFKLFVYVTVGTGISCCLVQNGRPHAGARGNAQILAGNPLGITQTKPPPPLLEEFASGSALVDRYNRHGYKSVARGEDVMAAVEAGEPVATEVVKTAGEALGVGVGWLVNVLDPEAVIVGGGLGLAGGLYWSSFVSSTRNNIWAEGSRGLPILPAKLGNDAGFIGAATMIRQRQREE
jgi:predicted NBD/HSP70 family sugar kinase